VVGAGAVVVHPAAELGKEEHHHVVRGVVLPQVGVEVRDGLGRLGPQLGVGRPFVGVGIVAAVLGVEGASAQIGGEDFGDALQVLGDAGISVLDAGPVLAGAALRMSAPRSTSLPV
jgi:hypothetical protein